MLITNVEIRIIIIGFDKGGEIDTEWGRER